MPRYTDDWESEYRDPISDKEDEKQKAEEEYLNAQIMAEIERCRWEEENRWLAEIERREWEETLKYEQELYEEDDYYEY